MRYAEADMWVIPKTSRLIVALAIPSLISAAVAAIALVQITPANTATARCGAPTTPPIEWRALNDALRAHPSRCVL